MENSAEQNTEFYIPAVKMNGLGNAILILDMRRQTMHATHHSQSRKPALQTTRTPMPLSAKLIRNLARNPETVFDQAMVLYDKTSKIRHASYPVAIYNRDGTQAKACGNGTRCLAEYLWQEQYRQKGNASPYEHIFYFDTLGGIVAAERHASGMVTVAMGKPDFTPEALPLSFIPNDMLYVPTADLLPRDSNLPPAATRLFPNTAALLSVGNPHAVFFLPSAADAKTADAETMPLAAYPLDIFGSALETSPVFPQGVNVSLAERVSPEKIRLRVWERGAGLTKACGTAACAAAAAGYKRGLTKAQTTVILPGGSLNIALDKGSCTMSGPTEFEYAGFIRLPTGEFWQKPC